MEPLTDEQRQKQTKEFLRWLAETKEFSTVMGQLGPAQQLAIDGLIHSKQRPLSPGEVEAMQVFINERKERDDGKG